MRSERLRAPLLRSPNDTFVVAVRSRASHEEPVREASYVSPVPQEPDMSEEDLNYERRLNDLLFDASNKTDELVRRKIAIIEAGNALQDSYLAAHSNAAASTTRC